MPTPDSKMLSAAMAFRRQLATESDRGCALLAAAYVDSRLDTLLRKMLVDDEGVLEDLLGVSRPLSSFSSRIDIAYLLGVLSAEERRDLHVIRKVRNELGHVPAPISFDSEAIASRCRELTHSWHAKSERPRDHFTAAVMGVLATIVCAILTSSHIRRRPNQRGLRTLKVKVQAWSKQFQRALSPSKARMLMVASMRAVLGAQEQELEEAIRKAAKGMTPDAPKRSKNSKT